MSTLVDGKNEESKGERERKGERKVLLTASG